MIKIEVYTMPDGGNERDQVIASLSAIGFAPLGNTAISTGVVGAEIGATTKPPSGRTRANKVDAAATQAISSGEERVDPAADAQDAKDEAAETAKLAAEAASKAAAAEPAKITHDNVKAMMGGYVMQFGMEAAQEDGEGIIGVPAISKIPDEQKVLAKAVLDIMSAIEKNPKNRDVNGDGITAEKIGQLKPIIAAAKAVK